MKDAEHLFSYNAVRSLERHGKNEEAVFVRNIAQWHEVSDGKGLSQLERSRYNYHMFKFILEEWMPRYRDYYDFSTIDINRYLHFKKNVHLQIEVSNGWYLRNKSWSAVFILNCRHNA